MKKVMLIDPDDYFTGRTNRNTPVPFDELKAYKKFKKFMAKEEAEKNKNKKDPPAGWWAKKSIAERTCIIAFLGPPAGIAYVFVLMQMVKIMAASMGIH